MAARTAERRQELRTALIDAAERAVKAGGLPALKARDLAAEVGCALGAIYTVFPNLDALIFEVNARTLAELERYLATRPLPAAARLNRLPPAVGELVRLALGYLDFAVADNARWRALFEHRMASDGEPVPPWYVGEQARLFALVEAPLAGLKPSLRGEQRKLLARTLFSGVHGIVTLGLEEKLAALLLPVLREQLRDFVVIICKGMAAAGNR